MRLALLAAAHAVHTVRWVNALAARGHEVHLLTMQTARDEIRPDVVVHRLPHWRWLGYYSNGPLVRRTLAEIRPDLLHAHYASGYGTLGRLARFRPYVLSVWGADVYDFPATSPLHRRILLANLRAADLICSTSRTMADHTAGLGPDIQYPEITPFGVDLNAFHPRTGERSGQGITVGTVKTLHPKYGVDLLVRAFARAIETLRGSDPDAAAGLRLKIVGGGPQETLLRRLAVKLGIDHVTEFTGPVLHSGVPSALAGLDIYVAASRYESESFGVAVIEASACGLPVIVADIGGLPEVVDPDVTGLIVEPENVEALSAAIRRLVLDGPMRDRLGAAGIARVRDLYDWEENVGLMERIYGTLVARHEAVPRA